MHEPQSAPHAPSLLTLLMTFLRLGCTAFGGPAMIPFIRKTTVNKRGWVTEETFRLGLALTQSIPGATAMQVAAYVGLKVRGLPGALAAYLGFGLPAFGLITLLTHLYITAGDTGPVLAAMNGLKFIVVALVAHASLDFSHKYLTTLPDKLLALIAALVLGFKGNPILALVGVCILGLFVYRDQQGTPATNPPSKGLAALRPAALMALTTAAVLVLLTIFHPGLAELARVMFKVDLFAFGGGYVSLPLMLHEVTTANAWMTPEVFMDGIALGQVTPGPIVITSAFVGYHLYGLLGALTGAVFAFTPSIIILAAAAPYFDRLQASPLFQRAVRASLASLVGLMAAVTARFAVTAPWSLTGALLALAAFIAIRRGVDILYVVLVGGVLSVVLL